MLLFLSLKDQRIGYYQVDENFARYRAGHFDSPLDRDFLLMAQNGATHCFVFDAEEFSLGLEAMAKSKGDEPPRFRCFEARSILFYLSGANREWTFRETLAAMLGPDSPRLNKTSAEDEAASLAFLMREALLYFDKSFDDLDFNPFNSMSFETYGVLNAIYQKRAFDKNIEDVHANLPSRTIEKLLFFDLECANCVDGIGKVCEFGCVIVDLDFNVIDRVFFTIDPDDRFMLRGRGGAPDLVLAYPEKVYFDSPKIAYYESKMRALLEDPSTLVGGFAVANDVSFLATDLDSYEIPQIEYDCFDVQDWVSPEGASMSLENAYREFVPTEEKSAFREHRSVDDAEMTMLVAKFYLKQSGKTLLDVLQERPSSLFSSRGYISYWLSKQDLPLHKRPKRIVSFPYPSGHGNHSGS